MSEFLDVENPRTGETEQIELLTLQEMTERWGSPLALRPRTGLLLTEGEKRAAREVMRLHRMGESPEDTSPQTA